MSRSPRVKSVLTAERLREVLHYEPVTGRWIWLVSRGGVRVGATAGTITDGYRAIGIGNRYYRSGRLAFLYMTGHWPAHEADHRNLIRDDDRWENLRDAKPHENSCNVSLKSTNSSGFKGIKRARNRWRACIKVQKKEISLGTFATPEEAHAAYCAAARELHGEFARLA